MATKLILTKNSPLDTTLVDEASGAVVYEIETEGSFFNKTTVIRKPLTGRPGERVPHTSTEVARIQWKAWSPDKVTYCGREMEIGEFMPKAGFFSSDYLITANGTEYRWSCTSGPQLVTKGGKKTLVAKLHKAHHLFDRRKAFLEVAPAGLIMLDQIVVSFVYVESKRRERQRRSDAAVQSAGASAGIGAAGGGC